MMALTDYTTYNEIRAVLGTNIDEIGDATLGLPMYAVLLEQGLEEIYPGLVSYYKTTKALQTPTEQQSRVIDLVQVLSAYLVARELFASLPIFSPQSITDGKGGFQRQSADYTKIMNLVQFGVERLTSKVQSALANVGEGAGVAPLSVPAFFSASTPAYDPVAGA